MLEIEVHKVNEDRMEHLVQLDLQETLVPMERQEILALRDQWETLVPRGPQAQMDSEELLVPRLQPVKGEILEHKGLKANPANKDRRVLPVKKEVQERLVRSVVPVKWAYKGIQAQQVSRELLVSQGIRGPQEIEEAPEPLV
jgi:hypothetical protein